MPIVMVVMSQKVK